jgi:hypothetical protein
MSAQTCTVTIGGVTKSVEQLRASLVLNGVGEASFDTIATGAAYVPSDGDAVVITLGGSTWWSGTRPTSRRRSPRNFGNDMRV